MDPTLIAAALGGLLLLLLIVKVARGKKKEPGYVAEVRTAVSAGNYKRAGDLQLRHGNLQQAYNLFERGNLHTEAAETAQRLGQVERAAKHAEQAGELEKAAELYDEAGKGVEAARLYKRVGRFKEAAQLMERDPNAQPIEIAKLWESFYVDSFPKSQQKMNEHQRKRIKEAAEKAADAYKRAGFMNRALHFHKAAQQSSVDAEEPLPLPDDFSGTAEYDGTTNTAELTSLGELPPLPPSQSIPSRPSRVDTPISAPGPEPYESPPSGTYGDPYHEAVIRARTFPPDGGQKAVRDEAKPEPVPKKAPQVSSRSVAPSPPPMAGGLPPEADYSEEVGLDPAQIDSIILESEDPAVPAGAMISGEFEAIAASARPSAPPLSSGSVKAAPVLPSGGMISGTFDEVPDLPPLPEQPALDKELVSQVVNEVLEKVGERPGAVHPQPTVVTRFEVIHVQDSSTNRTTEVRQESDRYVLGEKLGSGGMAVVYRAHDKVLERDVALKFLPEGITINPSATDLFEKEAKAVAKLNHANIITIYDYGVLDGRPFICMELVDGETLAAIIDRHDEAGLDVAQALYIADGLLCALEFAHSRDLIHRDVKPANVMLMADGTVKLMDFGIAKLSDSNKTTRVAGTPSYMAPEQMTGKGVDTRSDLFAVGVTLYEMLTGFLPFEGIRRDEPPIPTYHLRPEIDKRLDSVVNRCLTLDKQARPRTATELREQLHAFHPRGGAVSAALEAVPEPLELIGEMDTGKVPQILSEKSGSTSPEAKALFKAALSDSRAAVRASALKLHPGTIEGELEEQLLSAVEDGDKAVRMAAFERIGGSGRKDLLGRLADRLRYGRAARLETDERRLLMKGVVDLGGDEAIPLFRSLMEESSQSSDKESFVEQLSDLELALSALDSDAAIDLLRSAQSWGQGGAEYADDSIGIDIEVVPLDGLPEAVEPEPDSGTVNVGRPAQMIAATLAASSESDEDEMREADEPASQTTHMPVPAAAREEIAEAATVADEAPKAVSESTEGESDEAREKRLSADIEKLLQDYLGRA